MAPAGLRHWPAKGASQAPERLSALRSLAFVRGTPAKLGGAFLARTMTRARRYGRDIFEPLCAGPRPWLPAIWRQQSSRGGSAVRDHVRRRRAYRYGSRAVGRCAAPVPPVGAADRDPLRAADRDPRGAGHSAVPVPDPGQLHHRGTDAERVDLGPRQFRGGAERPPHRHHHDQLAGVRGGERGAGAAGRLGDGVDRRAHQHAVEAARLSHRDHLARDAVHPLRHGVAVVLRQGRSGQSSLPHAHRQHRRPDQHLLDVRHGAGGGLPVVAAGVPAGERDAAQRQSRAGGGGAGARRRRLADDPARDHAAVAAVDHGAGDAGVHPRGRGVRGAGAGRVARPHLGADHRHLHQHGGARAARHRRRQRAVGADAAAGVRAALYLWPAVAACGALRHHHRQGLPPAPVRPRAAALCRGRDSGFQFHPAAAGAHADAGVGVAVAVLPAGQRRGVQARQPQQLPDGAWTPASSS